MPIGAHCVLIVILATALTVNANISLGSCSLCCNENEDHAHDLQGTRVRVQVVPGKRGPVVPKGDRGVRGHPGLQGIPGEGCDCSRYDELATQVATLQVELNNLKGRVRPEDWTRASNSRWYMFFNNETVNYETARSRCAAFGGKLASAGLRTSELRSEIKRLLPNPMTDTWIGLDDLLGQGNYVWADGVPSTSSNTEWNKIGTNQPDSSSQRCVVMGQGSNNGRLHDASCTYNCNYLCEF